MKNYKVEIMPRPEALDPQGRAVKGALSRLGFQAQDCRVGKVVFLELPDDQGGIENVKEMAEKILANPLIETYKVSEV